MNVTESAWILFLAALLSFLSNQLYKSDKEALLPTIPFYVFSMLAYNQPMVLLFAPVF